MTAKILSTLLTAILFISCQTKNFSDQNGISSDTIMNTNIHEDKKIITDSVNASDSLVYSDCMRGQAEPIIKKTVYPNAIFKLNTDNLTGTETLDLEMGERLIINNWGCEYFVLTFRFETERFQADTTDVNYWLDKAVNLIREIENGIDAPLDIVGGTIAVENFSKENKNYNLGEEIVYDDDLIRDFVKIDRIQKVGDNRYAIEVSYGTGPL
jgi:hypothetical protein